MLRFTIVSLCLASSTLAYAEEQPATAGAEATTPTPAPAESVASASTSGLRNGFSLSAGQEFGGDRDISGTMFGIDWRIGWRINAPVSIYLHSHLSFGSAKEGNGASGGTGTFASALMGEYLLPMGLFVAGGAGYGVLNNPSGALVAVRAGYYPFDLSGVAKSRHLNISIDYRAYFADQGYGTVSQVQLTLGYDRF